MGFIKATYYQMCKWGSSVPSYFLISENLYFGGQWFIFLQIYVGEIMVEPTLLHRSFQLIHMLFHIFFPFGFSWILYYFLFFFKWFTDYGSGFKVLFINRSLSCYFSNHICAHFPYLIPEFLQNLLLKRLKIKVGESRHFISLWYDLNWLFGFLI